MIEDKKILCVVTARAGSKGIPGKNYRDLLGKPLFMWSVLAAMESKYVDQVIISSNCDECHKAYDKWYREESLFVLDGYSDTFDSSNMRLHWLQRPDEISGALSKNEDALIHAYKEELEFQFDADIIINLQPTSPVRLDNLLDRAIEAYHDGGYDSLLTATKDTPFIWQKIHGEWRYPVDKNDCCERKMRQEFEEDEFIYHDNGNIYLVDSGVLLDTECRIGHNPCIYETMGLENKQIDDDIDFEFIETMLKMKDIDSPIGMR